MQKKAKIIDGRAISEGIISNLKLEIDKYESENHTRPKLAIILVGDDVASNLYVQNKIKAAKKVGINADLRRFNDDISQSKLLKEIDAINKDQEISGLIVQMPLPAHIDKSAIIKKIDPSKDVDGFHPENIGMLYSPFSHRMVPCTAAGCLDLIQSVSPELVGKNVVIVGRSNIVGRPLAALLLKYNCTVTICHSKTKDLAKFTKCADIVVSAVGRPGFLTSDYFSDNAVVIDVGINLQTKVGKKKFVGDVDFNDVVNKIAYITPVPGGVGPMTVAHLLVNCFSAHKGQENGV